MIADGTCLGPYQILSVLGAGGMGEVYRARDTRLGREVAVKVLPAWLAEDETSLARFEREAKALAALSHSNILAIHDVGREQGKTFLVMELLEGSTLAKRIARGPIPWQKAVEIGIALTDGMAAAHSKGVIHRDLKPANIFLTADGGVKILDFGLARLETKKASPHPVQPTEDTLTAETSPGSVMGTMPYMSPEQVLGQPVDARSDIFSFGCVLFEMVTGRCLFKRPTNPETQTAILKEEPPEASGSGKRVPPELERVIRHCMEKNPDERYQTARDLAFNLRAVLTGSSALPFFIPAGTRRRLPIVLLALAVVLLASLLGLALYHHFRQPREQAIDSLAVLPFVNETGDPDAEYLSDGVTESLINNLSQLPNLKVIARSSAFRYKDKGQSPDPKKAGRELGVQAVLLGRVMQRGDGLVISVELVDVKQDRHLWGEKYTRKLADLLALQDEISQEITAKLRLRLSGEDLKRLTKRYTEDTDAYRAYLVGRYHWNRRTEEDLKKAITHFEQAQAKDPGYALAHAGLADCYALLGDYGYLPPRDAFPKAKAAAARALELDDALAEAHTSLAFVKVQFDWDWAGAEREYRRALELNPNYATAHQWYSEYLSAMGRHDEALTEIRKAQSLTPLALIVHAVEGRALYFARRYDPAVEQCRKTLEMDPQFGVARLFLGRAYVQKGKLEEAVAEFQQARRLSGGPPILAELGHAYAVQGKRDEVQKVLAELADATKQGYVTADRIAMIYAALGDKDQAFVWLEKAFQERSDALVFLQVEPRFDGLRTDPRFLDLVRRLGLGK